MKSTCQNPTWILLLADRLTIRNITYHVIHGTIPAERCFRTVPVQGLLEPSCLKHSGSRRPETPKVPRHSAHSVPAESVNAEIAPGTTQEWDYKRTVTILLVDKCWSLASVTQPLRASVLRARPLPSRARAPSLQLSREKRDLFLRTGPCCLWRRWRGGAELLGMKCNGTDFTTWNCCFKFRSGKEQTRNNQQHQRRVHKLKTQHLIWNKKFVPTQQLWKSTSQRC